MDRETKTLLAIIGVALAILWIARPKKSVESKDSVENKYAAPKEADNIVKKQKDDAVVALQAMRDAINNGENARNLDKLKTAILQDYNIKVLISTKTKKLRAMSKDGKVIAEEA